MNTTKTILNLIKDNDDQLDSVDIVSMSNINAMTVLATLHELEDSGKIVRCSKGIAYCYKIKS